MKSLESYSAGLLRNSVAIILLGLLLLLLLFNPNTSTTMQLPILHCLQGRNPRLQQLLEMWEDSYLKNEIPDVSSHLKNKNIPAAPHLQDCKRQSQTAARLDSRDPSGRKPFWRGESSSQEIEHQGNLYPPWIQGGDEDNLPMTRAAQRDFWIHQHPPNCSSDSSLKFLVTDWMNIKGLGLGAQLVAAAGMFAIALNEGRILVLKDFDRAKHEECRESSSYTRWSCYFRPETSEECRARAMELESDGEAWKRGTITSLKNYSRQSVWLGRIPEYWGKPWETMQPFDVVAGKLLWKHKSMDKQWWRAQAVRYFIRFPSEYMCTLLNKARHQAFGEKAAQLVLETLPHWPEVTVTASNLTDAERLVWVDHKPWTPRPLISMHVRQGDKASEMKIFDFETYMRLAQQIRSTFPNVKNIWLSTEMQTVVDKTSRYAGWNVYYTKVARQNGTTSMVDYENSLGTKVSSNNAFVNLLMAIDCDYFIGALGSTWSYLIDGMRLTNGKLSAGFLKSRNVGKSEVFPPRNSSVAGLEETPKTEETYKPSNSP